jgi:hypothetical protein
LEEQHPHPFLILPHIWRFAVAPAIRQKPEKKPVSKDNTNPARTGKAPVCPDCGAEAKAWPQGEHEPTCPVGRAVQIAVNGDRKWFLKNPSADERLRLAAWGELQEFRAQAGALDGDNGSAWYVLVEQIEPGLRTRRSCQLVMEEHTN